MSISLRLIENQNEIAKKINQAIAEQLNNTLAKKAGEIIEKVQILIRFAIKSQPEMLDLVSPYPNSLIGQFGIANASNVVENITNAIADSTRIKLQKYDKNLKGGGVELNIQPTNFSNLLALPDGHTVYENGDLHWLNWLLTRGDEIIVVGYEYNPQTGLGRSRLGNMKPGGSFRVPPQFSGTKDNNFITRALVNKEQENEIAKIFKTALGGP